MRPALVLYANAKSADFVACFISSRRENSVTIIDLKIKANKQNSLKTDSIVKVAKIATLEKRIATGGIGILDKHVLKELDKKLKILFSL